MQSFSQLYNRYLKQKSEPRELYVPHYKAIYADKWDLYPYLEGIRTTLNLQLETN